MDTKKIGKDPHRPDARLMVEDILKCKWTLSVLEMVRRGVNRPGAMVRQTEGLSTKVLNERLQKLQAFGVLDREVFPEKPPRVEYRLTPFGRKLNAVLDAIFDLQREIDDGAQ